ncbi:MAG: acyloxyacyl hydrolase [Bacteroidia bacterium]|nr:acyloxyacyl hydrolase [Bacteroidia bacterium]
MKFLKLLAIPVFLTSATLVSTGSTHRSASFLLQTEVFAINDSLTNVFLKFKPGFGAIVRHRESMGNLVRHVGSFQFEVGRQTYGKEPWEQMYHYPEYGLGYYFADLNDPKLLGYVHASYAYLNSPFFRNDKFSMNYHLAIGLSYVTRCWDYRNNYENLAIGTHLNVYFNVNLNASLRVSKKIELTAGIGGCHYSNGAVAQPNLGLNVIDFDIGFKYFLNDCKAEKVVQEIPAFNKKNEFSITLSAGTKGIERRGTNYLLSTASLYFARQLNQKRKVGFGTDIFYDETLYTEFPDSIHMPFSKVIRNGIFISHEFLIKKFSIVTQLGCYTYYKVEPFFPVYTRLALKYDITPSIFANIGLKAHMGVADFIEWGVGYRFK